MAVYALVVWLLSGLIQQQWWLQILCFAATTYLMVELNNANALIRVYSRMVSAAFLALMCASCFLFPSMEEAFAQLCVVATYLILFHAYQDRQSAGLTYYGFIFMGLASMTFPHILFFIPFIWLLMAFNLQTLSWRTFFASLLGLLTPYWFAACWLLYQEDFTPLASHFIRLGEFQKPFDFGLLTLGQILTLAFLVVIAITGTIHYLRTSYNDKIRIRQLYGIFIWMDLLALVFLCVQPQLYDGLIRLMIVNTSPLAAHFIALTRTRVTNVAFIIITLGVLLLTTYNLWISSLTF